MAAPASLHEAVGVAVACDVLLLAGMGAIGIDRLRNRARMTVGAIGETGAVPA